MVRVHRTDQKARQTRLKHVVATQPPPSVHATGQHAQEASAGREGCLRAPIGELRGLRYDGCHPEGKGGAGVVTN